MATPSTSTLLTGSAVHANDGGSSSAEARIDVDASIDKVPGPPPMHTRPPPNSHTDYVARRVELWEGRARAIEMEAVVHLPLAYQVAFRVKMLTIFALQLLLVGVLVGLCDFYPPVSDVVKTAFQVKIEYLGAAAGALVALLVLLYAIRALFPLNWLVLLVFSAAQAALFAALSVKFDTHLGVFNCTATFACIVIMLLLAPMRVCTSAERRMRGSQPKLLSPVATGFVAYVLVALAACALYVRFGREFVTLEGFAASLAFQFVLIMWFALDAAFMYRVMSPDEYMHGVIYFYTDMILLTAVCAAAAAAAALLVVTLGGGEGCDGSCDCSGCGGCGDCGDGGSGTGQVVGDSSDACSCSTLTWGDCVICCVHIIPPDWSCPCSRSDCSRRPKQKTEACDAHPGVEEAGWAATTPYHHHESEPQKCLGSGAAGVHSQEMQRV